MIIADSEIWFPRVLEPNVAVCLSQQAYDRFSGVVRPGGIIVVDEYHVRVHKNVSSRQFRLPFHATVEDKLGRLQPLNMCVLGSVVSLIPLVHPDSVRQTISERFDTTFRAVNLDAFDLGLGLVKESVRTF